MLIGTSEYLVRRMNEIDEFEEGEVIGFLKILKKVDRFKKGNHYISFICVCVCGTFKRIPLTQLRSHRSCGCGGIKGGIGAKLAGKREKHKSLQLRYMKRGLTDPIDESLFNGRPKKRSDCDNVQRPCPYISCRYNLFCDVMRTGSLKFNTVHLDPLDVPSDKSCVLDVVEKDGDLTLEATGKLFNLTREMIRQIQDKAMKKLSVNKNFVKKVGEFRDDH